MEIIFTPDVGVLGFQPTTEVTFAVDKKGSASFELINEIEPDEEMEEGSDALASYEMALKDKYTLFEDDKTIELEMPGLNIGSFIKKLE